MSFKKVSKRKCLQNSDPGKVLDLLMNLNDKNSAHLQTTINKYICEECEAETVILIVVHTVGMEASIEAVGHIVLSKKFKFYMNQKLMDVFKNEQEQTELLSNFGSDFQDIVAPFVTKEPKKRVLLYPILDKPFSVIVCIVAPKAHEEQCVLMTHEIFLFCWSILQKAIALEYECALKQKCQQLLRVARRLFTQVASLETLLKLAMEQAKSLIKAEFCSVMLIDMDRMQLVEKYRPEIGGTKTDENKEEGEISERRFPMRIGITGQVLKTGLLINSKNAREHPAYDASIDCYPGIDCTTILCFPIREETGIIGVGKLINKIGDPYFDAMDEEMALAFSVYCGVCITHSVVHEKIREAHIRNALANELIMYHMKVGDAEILRLLECNGFHNNPHFNSMHFNMRALPLRELPCYVMKMFADLGFIEKFNIKRPVLARFILHVKKGYRDVPYHNWLHAFNVAQWAYAAIINFKLVSNGYLSDLQCMMYLIAGLVHDMDHRGTTNSFQIQGQTTLAALYSSEGSVMERHHVAQAMAVLNVPGCDLLEALPRRDYDRAIMTLRDLVLATDLANYFKNQNEYKVISYDFQKGNRSHTAALQCMLMNCADLSDQLKDWGNVKKTAAAILTEFFKQGDVEKSRGDLPVSTMDRDKCFIPELQIQFLNTTCMPLFDMLGKIIPKVSSCVKILENHIERWEAAKRVFAEVPIMAGLSVLLSPELDNLIQQNLNEKERRKSAPNGMEHM